MTTFTEAGPHHRTWTVEPAESDSAAAPDSHSLQQGRGGRRIVEIESGMHFWDGQQWTPSDARFDISPEGDAFVADRVQHRTRLAANINEPGAVTVSLPDGTVLRSTPVAIGLFNAVSGESVILAGIQDCVGTLVSDNQVVYEDAFNVNGVSADIVYTIEKGSFAQDIVITGRLDPMDYGFSTNGARLQLYTELYDPPEPERVRQPIRVELDKRRRDRMVSPDLVDEMLGFGEFVIATGRAVVAGTPRASGESAAPVVKELVHREGRTFLLESVEFASVETELKSLPDRWVGALDRKGAWLETRYAAIPAPSALDQAQLMASIVRDSSVAAGAYKPAGLAIDYFATLGGTISGVKTFEGDTTFFVSGPVFCSGTVYFEGGAVFKYPNSIGGNNPTTAYIRLDSSVICKTSSSRPAIFTAGDDWHIGESLLNIWTGHTGSTEDKHYANPAIWMFYNSSFSMANMRFSHCQEAIRSENNSQTTAISLSHVQLVNCIRGIVLTGSGSGSGSGTAIPLSVNNALMSKVLYPFTFSTIANANVLRHCTIDQSTCLATASASATLNFANSIFASVPVLVSGPASLSGNYNGFYAAGNGFGTSIQTETQHPFAVTDGNVPQTIALTQGKYYLRDESPFLNMGLASIPTAVKSELAVRTTKPPAFFNVDVHTDLTLGQTLIRDTDILDLGYHYPAVDYIVSVATVNSATLRIDPGTVLAFTSPYQSLPSIYPEWCIRVNPGGRLIANGHPTNRVTFTRLEAIQESPAGGWQWDGPLISFKGLVTPNGPVKPLAEVVLRYTDVASLSGRNNVDFNNLLPDQTYDLVGKIELDGCHFQGGAFHYDSGGPQGRTISCRNTVFERTDFQIVNLMNYSGNYEEQVTFHNNLFYYGTMALIPVSGANWTFIDNIFDHVTFYQYNGPVGVNHHNAYVGMSQRLSPPAPTSTDPNISSLSYWTGSLGAFYLPSTASLLINKGSRSAQSAGLFHFTSLTSNAKEGDDANPSTAKQVDIGAHYVAVLPGPKDFDQDGLPDFLEDANGDGVAQTSEANWRVKLSNQLRIVPAVESSVLSGIASIPIEFDNSATNVTEIMLSSPDSPNVGWSSLRAPFSGKLAVDLDTRWLPNGPLSLQARANMATLGTGGGYATLQSTPVTVTIQNDVAWPDWETWTGEDVAMLNAHCTQPSLNYVIEVYDDVASPAKQKNPWPVGTVQGYSPNGVINAQFDLVLNQVWPGDDHPRFMTVLRSAATGARAFPSFRQSLQWPNVGAWYLAYEDSFRNVYTNASGLGVVVDEDVPPNSTDPRFHIDTLPAWPGVAVYPAPGRPIPPAYRFPPTPNEKEARTWPIRYCNYARNLAEGIEPILTEQVANDWGQFIQLVRNPDVRNLYIGSHQTEFSIGPVSAALLRQQINHRYHFVFLDGCASLNNAVLFGFQPQELQQQELTFYLATGPRQRLLRPAGGVAFEEPFVRWTPFPEGSTYLGYIPKGFAKFYRDFQDRFSIYGLSVLGSAQYAAQQALASNPPVFDLDGPWDVFRVIGYKDLRLNEFNEYNSRWW
ncbi:MAG: hypothetical protein KJ072_16075 [Verrucomicrobia bacterium]|nr:hypothetical protein [Verrucomicrobiota bacterium]